jgi:ligand-binding sensor domain-containing protein
MASKTTKNGQEEIKGTSVQATLVFLLLVSLGSFLQPKAHAQTRSVGRLVELPQAVRQVHVDPRPIDETIVDGRDIRFAHPYTGGLSQTKVAQIVQDDQGFMWFGTQYGLDRFDGYKFKVFVHNSKNPKSLSGVFINALFKDREGTIWVGCDQFLNRFDPRTETFSRYQVPSVYHISQDSAGVLWLSTTSGLYALNISSGKIQRYIHDASDSASLSSNDIKSSGEDRTGRFWVASREGLDEFDRRTGHVKLHIALREPSLGFAFFEDRYGVFWIYRNSDDKLYVLDRKTDILTHYSFHDSKGGRSPFTGIAAMLEDRDGVLWLATSGSGLIKFDREHRKFIRYRHDPLDPESLDQDSVISLLRDRAGIVWAGLGGKGATHFETKTLPFKKYRRDFGDPYSNAEPFVGAIYEDRGGMLWIGSHEGLSRIERSKGGNTAYPIIAPDGCTDVIAMREDHLGNLWIGTYGHGLCRLDRRTGLVKTFKHDPLDPHSLSNDIVTRLLLDKNDNLWAATFDGLNKFQTKPERFTTYKVDPREGNPFYLELVEGPDGMLWLGTHSSGLERFDPATAKFTIFQQNASVPGTISDNRVNSVRFDHSGTMWVGTQDGLDVYDAKAGQFIVYAQGEGLPGNAVGCVLEDQENNLWMSTNNGVARLSPRRVFETYSIADGLPGPDLTGWGACYKSKSGEMFFGGFSGATAFFPDKTVDRGDLMPTVLTDFRLFGSSVVAGPKSPLKQAINYSSSITLTHNQNVFSIEFSALDYYNSATNHYRYMLEGLDERWHEVESDERLATYTTLPRGTYKFRVQGSTTRGVWSEPGVMLTIHILPPWWLTWWFISICGCLMIVSLLSFYRYRVHQIALEFSLRLDERVLERTRLARDLHDTLLQTTQACKIVADTARDSITDMPGMRVAITKLSNWLGQAAEEGRIAVSSLRGTSAENTNLSEAIRLGTQEIVSCSPLKAEFEVIGTPKKLHPILREEVYRLACEAVRNACLHSGGSRVRLEVTYLNDFVLRVSDDGKGFSPEMAEKGKQKHFGLIGMKERATRIGGKFRLNTSAASGTEITLFVPGDIIFDTANRKVLSEEG